MKIEYRIGTYVLAILVVILVSIYTVDLLYITRIPAVAPFGFALMIFFILLDTALVVWEWMSPQVICNVENGHFSINATKDMFDIPWQVSGSGEAIKKLNLIQNRIMLTGGIDYWGISMHSRSDKPVLIAPALFCEKKEKNYDFHAVFEKYEIEELPMYLQYIIKRHFPNRIKEKTPIYYSEVSDMDGSATPENMKILLGKREDNMEESAIYKRQIRLYDEMERGEKHKNKIFFKKELEEVKDEEK